MDAIADLADRYSFGEIRVGHEQNLVLPHVAQRDLLALWQKLEALGLATPNVGLVSDIIACPGLDYCSLANARSIPVAQELTRRFRDHELARTIGRLHINISGCINACGHHHVGHIGILGVEKNGEEFYQITLGGRADEDAELGTLLGPAVPYGEVADVVEDVVAAYVELRETPDGTVHRHRQADRRRAIQGACLCHSLSQDGLSRTSIVRIADDAPMPDGVAVIVSRRALPRRRRSAHPARARPVGVLWPNNRPIAELAPYLDRLALVALVFPSFRDGRAYSQARILRERYGFRGELRATGQVLRDQFLFLLRAGFDSFEVTKEADAAAFAESIRRFDVFYQPTGDGRATAFRRRLGRPLQAPPAAHVPEKWTPVFRKGHAAT